MLIGRTQGAYADALPALRFSIRFCVPQGRAENAHTDVAGGAIDRMHADAKAAAALAAAAPGHEGGAVTPAASGGCPFGFGKTETAPPAQSV